MIDLARPGIMLYFDVRPCLKRLTMEQQGELFNAILDFGENGVVPSFDGLLGIAWDFIEPKLVRDNERYEKTVSARRAAAQSRWDKQSMQMHANADFAMQTMPTTTSTPTATTTSKTTTTGECEGAEQQTGNCIVSSLDGPEKIDFEKERSRKLAEFAKWAKKQENA